MSVQYMDNFQFYGLDATNMLEGGVWSNIYSANVLSDLVDDPDVNADAESKAFKFEMSSTGASVCRLALPAPGQQQGVGCRLWWSGLPSGYNHGGGIQYNTAGNLPMYLVAVTPTGTLRLIRRDKNGWTDAGDTVVAESAPLTVGAGAWQHVEWFMDTATGDYEIRVEGVQVLAGNDASHHSDSMGIFVCVPMWDCTASDSQSRYIKDLILWDDNGSVNNDFLGPVTIYSLPVDGDISSGWTPSSGTEDWSLLNELTPNDAGYIDADATLPAPSIMTFRDLPADVVGVRALQMMSRVQKTDGGDATVQLGLTSNGDTDTGADHAPGTSYTYAWDVSELDPDTASLWSPLGVNAAYLQIDRTL